MCVSLSVRPSVHTELLGSHWLDFHEMLLKKSVEKIQVSLKSDDNDR